MNTANLILDNVTKDANYAPYCLGCSTMERMRRVEPHYWRCRHCRGECDLRAEAAKRAVQAVKPRSDQ